MGFKKLIVNCDGTWMNADTGTNDDGTGPQVPSNVTRIGHAIKSEDSNGVEQIVYYQAGIGTGPSLFDKYWSGAVGAGLKQNVGAAYGFLANNYDYGDEIYITGFSRGAFTARCVAGLVGKIGILTKIGMEEFYDIFEDFEHRRITDEQIRELEQTQKTWLGFTENGKKVRIAIKAVGVWDTVGSLGIPWPSTSIFSTPSWIKNYSFWDTNIGNHIEYAFHAISLNEKRDLYLPTLWENSDPTKLTTKLEQVWFAGDHAGVGGGWPDSNTADITLAWMMSRFSTLGLEFKDEYIPRQFQRSMQYFDNNKLDRRNWGLGLVNDKASDVTSLYFWTGQLKRHPGSYHEKDPETGKDKSTYLQNTNESIHASVRYRQAVQEQNKKVLLGSSDSSEFEMNNYTLSRTNPVEWKSETDKGTAVLEEKDLGKYEQILLALYDRKFPGTWKNVLGTDVPSHLNLPQDTLGPNTTHPKPKHSHLGGLFSH